MFRNFWNLNVLCSPCRRTTRIDVGVWTVFDTIFFVKKIVNNNTDYMTTHSSPNYNLANSELFHKILTLA